MVTSTRRVTAEQRPCRSVILIDGSSMEFDALYRQEYASMVALARAICGDHDQAEDLAQEAMTRAHDHWTKIRDYDKPGAWVRRVTINLALSRRRRFKRELVALRRSEAQRSIEREADAARADEAMTGPDDEVWAAVRSLPPKQRAAVALFYQQDLSTSDIADALSCSVSTATSHLNQARNRLAELLNEPLGPTGGGGTRRPDDDSPEPDADRSRIGGPQ